MARGGARSGTPGRAYGQRTDLHLAPTAAPAQPYGAAGAQLASQQIVPMAPSPSGTSAAPPASAPSGGAAPPVLPGGLGHIARPTERPGEHVMTGVATGPGAGPEAIPGFNPASQGGARVSELLDEVAQRSGIQALSHLADQARSLGQ